MTLPLQVNTGSLIGSEWVSGSSTIDVINPATGGVLATVSNATIPDCLAAVDAAERAFESWSKTAPRVRGEILRRAYELMISEHEALSQLITLEMGKVITDARAEVAYAAEFFRWFSEEAVRIDGDYRRAPNGNNWLLVTRQPVGVSLLATPWNFPAAMATRKIAPALAAGCTVILKPAHETPLTALWIGDVMKRAGVPDGVVNIITASHSGPIASAILSDPRVATLSFTGSTYVGKLLLKQTAERVLPSSMELGGNAPFVVLEGSDVDAAVSGAMVAKMRNGGSACTAANRFYVHASIAEEFSAKLETAFAGLKMGPGVQTDTDLGAMVSQKEADKILELLGEAAGEGVVVKPAQSAPTLGAFVAPHVVRGVQHGSVLTKNEIFGPVAPIVAFESTDDAVRMANDTEFGLISYVYAPDAGTGVKIARRMESGMVAINRGLASDPAAPFGGMKESGLGREGGFAGIHEFLETQYFAVDL